MERIDSIDEIETHDEDLVIICGRDELFGTPIGELVNDVRARIHGEQLTVEEFPRGKQRIERYPWLVQHSVWFIHYEEFLEGDVSDRLDIYFDSELLMIPKETEVFVCINDREGIEDDLKNKYEDLITTVTREEMLVELAAAHLNRANPARGKAGKESIKAWHNAVCTVLNDFGSMSHG